MTLVDYPVYLFVVVLVALFVVVEIGFWLTQRGNSSSDAERHAQIVSTRNEIGVLLSLLLGFTLAMVLSRFDLRKQLVVDEANAIGTAGLRAQMLPEAARSKAQDLFREYTDTRLDFSNAGLNQEKLQTALAHSKRVQHDLWQLSVATAQQSPTPITALFISSLNDTIDLDAKRLAALENRVPHAMWFMLILLAVLTCLMVGYSQRRRFLLAMLVPPLMISIVMTLIADLDTPASGLIQVGHESIERLRTDLKNDSANP